MVDFSPQCIICLQISKGAREYTDKRMLEAMIRAWAGRVGARAGYQYGEEFRREVAGSFVTELVGAT